LADDGVGIDGHSPRRRPPSNPFVGHSNPLVESNTSFANIGLGRQVGDSPQLLIDIAEKFQGRRQKGKPFELGFLLDPPVFISLVVKDHRPAKSREARELAGANRFFDLRFGDSPPCPWIE
jgi:hypothetical protein